MHKIFLIITIILLSYYNNLMAAHYNQYNNFQQQYVTPQEVLIKKFGPCYNFGSKLINDADKIGSHYQCNYWDDKLPIITTSGEEIKYVREMHLFGPTSATDHNSKILILTYAANMSDIVRSECNFTPIQVEFFARSWKNMVESDYLGYIKNRQELRNFVASNCVTSNVTMSELNKDANTSENNTQQQPQVQQETSVSPTGNQEGK